MIQPDKSEIVLFDNTTRANWLSTGCQTFGIFLIYTFRGNLLHFLHKLQGIFTFHTDKTGYTMSFETVMQLWSWQKNTENRSTDLVQSCKATIFSEHSTNWPTSHLVKQSKLYSNIMTRIYCHNEFLTVTIIALIH